MAITLLCILCDEQESSSLPRLQVEQQSCSDLSHKILEKKTYKLIFGIYVQVHEESNDLVLPKTSVAIALLSNHTLIILRYSHCSHFLQYELMAIMDDKMLLFCSGCLNIILERRNTRVHFLTWKLGDPKVCTNGMSVENYSFWR